MLGVIVALSWELKTLTRRPVESNGCTFIGDDVTVALSGIGPERARAAASLLRSRGATALMSWGCAAALDRRLKPGTLLLPRSVIHASGAIDRVTVDWHRELYNRLSNRGQLETGPLAEALHLLGNPAEKQLLARESGAVATDMESAAQAAFAREHGLPFVVVRAALDTVSTRIPHGLMQAVDHNGKLRTGKFLRRHAFRAGDWIPLVQLGIQFGGARRTLRRIRGIVFDVSEAYLKRYSPGMSAASRE